MSVSASLPRFLFGDFGVEGSTTASREGEIESEEICSLVGLEVLEPACVGDIREDRILTGVVRSADMEEGVAGVLAEKRGSRFGERLCDTEGGDSVAFFAAIMALKLSSSKP